MFPRESGKIFFAPMEGVTDDTYRNVIEKLYPEWDYLACDFLRVPTVGRYPTKHLLKHFGKRTFHSELRNKTLYQILTSTNANTEQTVQDLEEIGIEWLDINLGCPSKTVVKNKGGSFLLKDPKELQAIIKLIRKNFSKTFTAKIRIGFEDDSLFEENLKILEGEGVQAITIHGRTREQLYKGRANWGYIKKAVELLNIPVVANGDIWTIQDIKECFEFTGCHSVMIARGALKTPWLASLYKEGVTLTKSETKEKILEYFQSLHSAFDEEGQKAPTILKSFKGLSRYLFEDFEQSETIKKQLLRSKELGQFFELINNF